MAAASMSVRALPNVPESVTPPVLVARDHTAVAISVPASAEMAAASMDPVAIVSAVIAPVARCSVAMALSAIFASVIASPAILPAVIALSAISEAPMAFAAILSAVIVLVAKTAASIALSLKAALVMALAVKVLTFASTWEPKDPLMEWEPLGLSHSLLKSSMTRVTGAITPPMSSMWMTSSSVAFPEVISTESATSSLSL